MSGEPAPALSLGPTADAHRKDAHDDYIIAVHPTLALEKGLRDYAVVTRKLAEGPELRAYGRVRLDRNLAKRELRLDQTLRNALGIPYEIEAGERHPELDLFPLTLGLGQTLLEWFTRVLGRRYLFLRVAKLDPPDIEKNICRVPLDALCLLGTAAGKRVVLVSCLPADDGRSYRLHNMAIKAFELSDKMVQNRVDLQQEDWGARYVNAAKLLGVEPDIASVYLDAHARNRLQLEAGQAVKVRRDFPDLFWAEAVEIGILFFVSLFALGEVLPELFGWRRAAIVPLAAILSVLFLLVRIRARVK
ncbi:MAG TPA: hypothetical protein ENJ19_04380 [Gammaproteobacteria bacterium]|nr:hypothetical protein [Gammaproteobacteria bacterium]